MGVFSVILYSNESDRFQEAVSFAAAARAKGKTALIFLRGPALKAFVEDRWARPQDPKVDKALSQSQPVSSTELLAEIRSKGKVHVYACSAWARMLHLPAEKVAASVDAVIGLNAFLTQSEGGPVLYM